MPHKGYKMTEEHKRKIGNANRLSFKPETRKRYSLMYKGKKRPEISGENHPLFGKHPSQETRDKMSNTRKGKMPKFIPINWYKGKKRPKEHGEKISLAKMGKSNQKISGDKNWNWKGGISPEREVIRHSMEYSKWVKEVFKRDKYKCQKYGTVGGLLVVHHILNFSEFPELRFEVNNGITFSKKAHDEFHKKYGKRNNTKEQLLEFLTMK